MLEPRLQVANRIILLASSGLPLESVALCQQRLSADLNGFRERQLRNAKDERCKAHLLYYSGFAFF